LPLKWLLPKLPLLLPLPLPLLRLPLLLPPKLLLLLCRTSLTGRCTPCLCPHAAPSLALAARPETQQQQQQQQHDVVATRQPRSKMSRH
jgi:hypothetical protein